MPIALYPVVAIILFASNALIPQLGVVAAVFSPLVMMLYLAHDKRAKHYDIFVVMAIVALAVFNHILAGFFVISPLFSAVFMRYLIKRNLHVSWLPIVGASALSYVITLTVIYGIASYQADLVEFTTNALKTFMAAAKEVNAPMVQSPYFAQIEADSKQAALSLVLIFPAFNYVYTAFSAYVSLRLYSKIKSIPTVPFRMPDNIVWVLIAAFGLIFVPFLYGRFIGINFAFICLSLYAIQGFEIILFWMNKIKALPLIKAVIFIFIFSEPPIILIISLIGLFSVWFNFYGKPPKEEKED